MKAAAIIPARGGSRRIPGKNIRPFHGRPIICYSIDTAIRSGLFEAGVWVSTEDPEIARVAWDAGAKVHPRQKELAENDVGTQQVVAAVAHALWPAGASPDALCCIYPCAPLMTVGDLRVGYGMLASGITPYVYTVGPDGVDAGQWYWGTTGAFLADVPLDTPAHRAMTSQHYRLPAERTCDVNTFEDWERAHWLYRDMLQEKCQHAMQVIPNKLEELVRLRCSKCGYIPPQ